MVEMSSLCTVEPPACCSPHASVSSASSSPSLISMEKHQRHQSIAVTNPTIAIDTNDCFLSPRLLDYSPSSTTSTAPLASDALRIAHEQLRKVYIAEASLLTNMEQCSSSLDLDHIMDGLRRLAIFEADIQRRLFCHIQLLSS